MAPENIKRRLNQLRYLRKRYANDAAFKAKIIAINNASKKKSQEETKRRALRQMEPWGHADMEQIENYRIGKIPTRVELAFVLGRTYAAIGKQLERLGIRKTRNLKHKY